MMINIIVAVDKNWGIGKDGKLLLSIPEDMKFFKETTTGNTVIMGRKTLESFPNGKPLPNRTNIVITRNPEYSVEGALIAGTPEEALEIARKIKKDIYIIGGGSIYEDMLNSAENALVTYIDDAFEADIFFPDLDKKPEWVLVSESEELTHFDTSYYFRQYKKRPDYIA